MFRFSKVMVAYYSKPEKIENLINLLCILARYQTHIGAYHACFARLTDGYIGCGNTVLIFQLR